MQDSPMAYCSRIRIETKAFLEREAHSSSLAAACKRATLLRVGVWEGIECQALPDLDLPSVHRKPHLGFYSKPSAEERHGAERTGADFACHQLGEFAGVRT